MRRFAFTFVTGIAAAALLAAGFAEAATCYTLRAELEHLQSQGGGDTSRYDRAFQEQMSVLARTESRARTAGCFGSGFFLFRRQPERDCRVLIPKLREMQANLARLDRFRRRGGGNPRRVRQIRAAMAERGCGIPGRERQVRVEERARDFDGYGRGTFRTLCVRTCDGYYFPISFSTRREQFGVDAQTCAAMCPGTEARLFYHRNPGGGPEDMISLEEQRYSDLSTAFQYRTSLSPSCTCKPPGGYGVFAADPIGEVREEERKEEPGEFVALLPRPRSAPGEDPETLSNRAGGFAPRAAAAEGVANSAATPGGSSIRVVGPAYPLAPEQAGVVLTPVPN